MLRRLAIREGAPKFHLAPNADGSINLNVSGRIELVAVTPEPEILGQLTIQHGLITIQGRSPIMYTMPVDHFIVCQVSYVDSHGNAAAVDGPVTWASSNDAVATVSPDGDACTVTASGGVGNAQITATADADLGEGVRTLVTLLDLNVVAGEAVAGTINVTQESQPTTPPA